MFQTKLTPKQKIFVDEYLKHGDPIKAVNAAGYKTREPGGLAMRLIEQTNSVRLALKNAKETSQCPSGK